MRNPNGSNGKKQKVIEMEEREWNKKKWTIRIGWLFIFASWAVRVFVTGELVSEVAPILFGFGAGAIVMCD